MSDVASGRVRLSEVDPGLLPEDLRRMSQEQREKHVNKTFTARMEIQDEIET